MTSRNRVKQRRLTRNLIIKRELSSNLKEKSNQEDEISNSQYEKLLFSLIDNDDSTFIFSRKRERSVVNFKKMTFRKNQNQLSINEQIKRVKEKWNQE